MMNSSNSKIVSHYASTLKEAHCSALACSFLFMWDIDEALSGDVLVGAQMLSAVVHATKRRLV
jgi:hypothetical protein